jgi:hypothetical protein
MKIIYLVLVSIFITSSTFAQSNEVWLETDSYKTSEVANDNVGEDVKVDITCSAETVSDCKLKARKIALYDLIFKGYDQNSNGASAISKLVLDMGLYAQKRDFFISYLNEESKGLQWAQGIINVSKPGGDVKEGRSKLKKVTVTVTLKMVEIRKDLEAQNLISSKKKLAEALKYKPRIIIKPSDSWLSDLKAIRTENSLGESKTIRDWEKLLTIKDFELITNAITKSIGDGFDIQSIASQLNSISNSKVNDQLSSYGLSESNEDMMARTLSADLYLDILYTKELISGGQEVQFNISLAGVDPLTNTKIDKLTGNQISKKTSGDNFTELLKTTLKSATNDFINGVSEYFMERLTDGMPCAIEFRIAKDLENEKTFNGYVKGKKFKTLIDETVKKLSKTGDKVGADAPTMLNYLVKIDALQDIGGGKTSANSVETFAEKVFEEMSNKLEGFYLITSSVGKGKVVAIFTKQEPK